MIYFYFETKFLLIAIRHKKTMIWVQLEVARENIQPKINETEMTGNSAENVVHKFQKQGKSVAHTEFILKKL